MQITLDQKLAEALREIIKGSEDTGRWLDESGDECGEDDDGAEWHEYNKEEQNNWLGSCLDMARSALKGYEEAAAKQAALLQQARDALEMAMLAINSETNPETADQVSAAYEAMVAGVPSWRPTVHVFLEGGNVIDIVSDVEGLRTAVVDHDINGCDEESTHSIPQADGSSVDASGHRGVATYSPEHIEKVETALMNAPNYRTPDPTDHQGR
ncbi:hypothetical protein VPH13_12820 [Stenotrophomonas pavanii]|uniref:hypothetical protein n=1 Tax=Stenotrophomonas pavanii TaxID=487698 RepID=UPI002DB832F2|nr:hypothetical protein [Stenotrophomonas pavanii]MEC4339598.1 hypothetical protein [Stenotrophomonas pavanii]